MGNDGGSIPKRHELVRTKTPRSRDSDAALLHQQWAFCALSKLPLRAPVVACPLGRMYNKDALIAHLLSPSPSAVDSPYGLDGALVAGHLRSLRDVVTLRLTPNPALSPTSGADSGGGDPTTIAADRPPPAPFVCPVSLREMNGSVRFVYRTPCGCVVSESALRELRRLETTNTASASSDTPTPRVCPVDGAEDPAGEPERWVTLNPKGEEAKNMLEAWDQLKQREREEKKAAKAAAKAAAKKRKAANAASGEGDAELRSAADRKDGDAQPPKRARKAPDAAAENLAAAAHAPAVKAGSSVPRLSATLAARLAEEKKKQSPAIASLYAKKGADEMRDKDGRSNWMTIGSYSRF